MQGIVLVVVINKMVFKLIKEIEDDQFIGHSLNPVKEDAEKLSKQYPQTKDL